jgi:methylated-DNA-protein-cysteine methyltransferase related protein
MSRSPFFARIKMQVTLITAAVPLGQVTTFKEVADWIAVPPRHVAYILATLSVEEEAQIPWFRIVADTGVVPTRSNSFGIEQRDLLREEGLSFLPDGSVSDFIKVFIPVAELQINLPKQSRPENAPQGPKRHM